MRLVPWLAIRCSAIMCILMVLVIRSLISIPVLASPSVAESTPTPAHAVKATKTSPVKPVKTSPKKASECHVSSKYPANILRWCDLITQYAEKANLSPNLVAAVMLQESGGNPEAYSSSGAVGLMQVMPKDGKAASFQCANGPCFANRPSMQELLDPDFNIQYGTRMLTGLYNRYQDVREALKAYGPMNVGYYYADKVLAIYERYGE